MVPRKMTPQYKEIAKDLADNLTHAKIAEKHSISLKTIERLKVWPEMVEYMASLIALQATAFEAKVVEEAETRAKGISFSFSDAAAGYLEIRNKSTNDFCKLKAIDSLVALFGVAKGAAGANANSEQPERPDVYRAEWLRKPQ